MKKFHLKIIVSIIFPLLLICFFNNMANAQSWYNSSWLYRKAITIDYTKVGAGPHTNFPVLINITDANLQASALSTGYDILFTSSDGTTKIDHEIESYTSGTGALVAWVEIPSLSSAANTVIYMYYGNAAATNQQNVTGSWDATFKGVYHMNTVFTDATSNANNGTNTGTIAATGKISGGRGYVRSDGIDFIQINGLMSSPASFTLSAWATLTTADPNAAEIISIGDYSVLRYDEAGANKTSGVAYNGASVWTTTGSGINYAGTGWHYVVYTFDNVAHSQKVYVDGTQVAATSSAASPVYTGGGTNTFIGKHGNGNANMDFDGTIDEARVASSARSAGWVLTEYNNQNSPSTFYSIGSQVCRTNISQIPTSNLILNYKFNGNASDETGTNNGTLQNAPTASTDRFGNAGSAYTFNGTTQYVSTANSYVNPGNYSTSIWFKTATTTGGVLMGFGNAQTGSSTNYDRNLYMNNAGQLFFGNNPGVATTINSTASFNDNNWHLATATLSGTAGMYLYVDGVQVAVNASLTTAQNYTGYWRVGFDNLQWWPSVPTSYYFNGSLDDPLIYQRALTSAEVATLYNSPDGAGNNGPLCSGTSLNLTATTVASTTYSWTGPNSFASSSQNPTLTYTSAKSGVYTVQATTSGCVSATAYTNVASAAYCGKIFTGTGNFSTAARWTGGTLPIAGENIIIDGACTVDNNVGTDNVAYGTLVIGTATGRTLNWAVGGTNRLNVSNVSADAGASTLDMTNGGTLIIRGTLASTNLAFTPGTGTMEIQSTMTLPAAYTTYNNLTVNSSAIVSTGVNTTVNGSLNVAATLQLVTFNMTAGNLQGAGTIISSGGTPALAIGSLNTSTTFSGVIGTGAIALTKNGTGALTLSGNNSYTGVTTIAAGTLKLGNINALGTTAGATSVTSGAVLDLNGITYSAAEGLTLNGTGISTGGALINSNTTAASYAGNILLASATQITANNPMTLSGVISGGLAGSNASVTIAGSGGVLFSGNNTYTGQTIISGVLRVGANNALGAATAASTNNCTIINSGGTLDLYGTTYVTNEYIEMYGTGSSGGGAVINSSSTTANFACQFDTWSVVTITVDNPIILSGTVQWSGGNLTVAGASVLTLGINSGNKTTGFIINSGVTVKFGADDVLNTTGGNITINSGGVLDLNGFSLSRAISSLNGTGISGGGALTNSGATAATCSGAITLGSAAIIAGVANQITVSGTITGAGFGLTLAGTAGGSVTNVISGTSTTLTKVNAGTWTLSGANTFTGGTTLSAGQLNINHATAIGSGALTINGGIINNTTAGLITLSNNNTQNWNGDFTFTGTQSLNMGTGDVTLSASRQITVSANMLTVGGIINQNTLSLTKAGNGTLSFSNQAITLNNLTISAGTLTSTSGTLNLAGNFSNSGTYTHNSGTLNFNGASPQTISGTTVTNTFNNFTVAASSTVTSSTGITGLVVNGTLTTGASAILDLGTTTVLSGTLGSISNTGNIKTSVPTATSATPIPGGKTWGGTIYYNAATGAQTVVGATYNNLINNNSSGANTVAGDLTVSGQLSTTTGGTLDMGSSYRLLSIGTTSNNGTVKTSVLASTSATPFPNNTTWNGSGTVEYAAVTGAQTVVWGTYNTNLKLSNTSGTNSITGNVTLNGVFTLSSGTVTTGAYLISLTSTGSLVRTSGYVIGNLKKYIATGATSKTFEIGDATNYTPVTLAFANITTAQYLTATVTATDHPSLSGSGIRTDKSVNRYWSFINQGIIFTTATLTVNWVAGDVDGGATTSNFAVGRYNGSTWALPSVASPLATSIQATGLTSFADFAVGETCTLSSGFSYAGSPYCSNAGTATPTITGTSGTFTSTAGLSITPGTGAVNLAASTAGTYVVTNSATSAGGCTSSSTANITITAMPSATISYAGTPFCSSGGVGSVTRTGTAGGAYTSTAGLTINAATGAITPGTSTAGTYTVTYTMAAAGGCVQATATTSVTINSNIVNITCPSPISSYTNPVTGLIAAYPFSQSSGTTANEVIGTKNGVLTNGPTWNTGKYGNAVYLNGTNNYVSLPTGIVNSLSGNYTISSWVYLNSQTATWSRIFDFGTGTNVNMFLTPRNASSNVIRFAITTSGAGGEQVINGNAFLTSGSWHHVVVTLSGTTGILYVDGTNVGTNASMTIIPSALGSTTQNYIGKSQYGVDPYLDGDIDEFRIYNTALTSGEVSALYSASACAVSADLGSGIIGNPVVSGGCGNVTVTNNATYPLPLGANTITWTATDAAANTNSCNQSVTVLGATSFTGTLTNQCVSNTSYTLTGGSPAGGTYSGTGVSGTNFNASVAGPGTHIITYTSTYSYADGNSCPVSATNSITVSAIPAATISYSGTPFCKSLATGQAVTQTGTSGGTYAASPAGLTINAGTGAITPSTSTAGTYTVTYTMAAAGGCSQQTATTSVTITTSPAATISYAATPFCSTTGVSSVSQTGTAGGSYSSTAGLTINAGTGAITPSTSTAGTYTVFYDVSSAGGCSSFQTSTSVSIVPEGTWTGAVNTDWNNGGNWLCGTIPTSSISATIATGLSNYPVIVSNASVNNITIENGATVTVTATLQIAGAISNAGVFDVSAGTVDMNGSSPQTIPANIFLNNSIESLIIDNDVTLGGSNTITGVLSFGSAGKTLYTGNLLTLRSTASGTARLAPVPVDASGNATCFISGTVTVERYMSNGRAWRILTAPLSNTGNIYNSWQNGGQYDVGKGLMVTGPSPSVSNGLDISNNNATSMKSFDANTQGYSAINNTKTTNLSGNGSSAANKAYFTFVRGDRNPNNLNPSNSNTTTLASTGNLQTGNQVFAVSNNINEFTTVGNPYASPVDFNKVFRTKVMKRFYVWDPHLNQVGGYVVLDDLDDDGIYSKSVPASTQDKNIQSGQGFFVLTDTSGAASISFNEASKSTTVHNAAFRPAGVTSSMEATLNLLAADSSTIVADAAVAEFKSNYQDSVDLLDASKFGNLNETFGILRYGKLLAIERRPEITSADTLFFKLTKTTAREYQFVFNLKNISPAFTAVLEDKFTGSKKPVNITGTTVINFSITTNPASAVADRFRLVFRQVNVLPVTFSDVSAKKKGADIEVNWKVDNQVNIKKYEIEKSADGRNFIKVGDVSASSLSSDQYTWLDIQAVAGDNYYRIKDVEAGGRFGYSKIVKVTIDPLESGIVIYPNPVTGNTINIRLTDMPAGTYQVRMQSAKGQLILSKEERHNGGNASIKIPLAYTIAKGIYQLEITPPGSQPVFIINLVKE